MKGNAVVMRNGRFGEAPDNATPYLCPPYFI
ncbi:hypothetical protein FHS15_000358 [Paenibacillus castaneae]|nr:hypothetical protein [Paenibacillus castaneae]